MLCARPVALHRDSSGQLHKDGELAIRWPDGWGLPVLHGVRVPSWLALEPAIKIDPAKFAGIENADMRREFVRKVGVERIAQHCGAETLDRQGEMYELLSVDLKGTTGKWPYLKMRNPSIGCWHLEAVPRECKTVAAALTWRNQTEQRPEILT